MMQQCCRFIVSGRVQGVFFRSSTRDKAQQLELNGWVRNLSTGHVELLACGEKKNIEKLKQWLWQGPEFAKVTDVKSETMSDTSAGSQHRFSIRRDG
ncbi:MAG: acylphosphatase [Arenicellales bacterium]